ncbi:MAG TPA: alpha/beta hydrolase [Jiangellaceae bacterium]
MGKVSVNGISLYCEERGTGSPMLCIHGGGSSALLWAEAVPELARRGRVITYDRRGCTRSERPEPYEVTTVREQADDAAALLTALDAAPAVVIGRSYGGEIAVDLVQRYPDLVRALVLLEPAIPTLSRQTLSWWEALSARYRADAAAVGPEAATEGIYRVLLSDATWDRLPDAVRQIFVDNSPALLAEIRGEGVPPDAAALARVTQPVLIVSGESSPEAFGEVDDVLAGMIPETRHEIVSGGHLLNPASPVVLDFLDEIMPTP